MELTVKLDGLQGGKKTLLMGSGKDATEEFEMLHPPNVLKKYAQHIRCLGDVV